MLTVIDLDAAMLEAEAQVAGWELEFQQNFNRPLIVAALVKELLIAPPTVQAAFKAADPETFEMAQQQIARLRKTGGSYGLVG